MMTIARTRRIHTGVLAALLAILTFPSGLFATWSIIAVDTASGIVVIASATCVSQENLRGFPSLGLMDIQAIIVPGIGVAAAQAGVDRTRANQRLIHRELNAGTDPTEIIRLLQEDPDFQSRQFGIVDMTGRSAGFSGADNRPASLDVQGNVPGTTIHFSVQGNILASDDVVNAAVEAFLTTEGTVTDRVMAAMEAADRLGGDSRCTCETEPVPDAPCDGRNAHVAYIAAAEPDDPEGESFNDGEWSLFIDVTDENIEPVENANPVITLRMRYDAWRSAGGSVP